MPSNKTLTGFLLCAENVIQLVQQNMLFSAETQIVLLHEDSNYIFVEFKTLKTIETPLQCKVFFLQTKGKS